MLKVLRDGGREIVVFAEKVEFKAFRVQKVSGRCGCQQLIGFAGELGAVELVADYGMSEAAEMDTDLVHAAGFRLRFDEIEVVSALHDRVMRDGIADFSFGLEFVVDNDLLVQSERSGDRFGYDAFFRLYMAINDSGVGLLYRSLLEHGFEFHEDFLRFGGDTDAGRILVEAMNDARTERVFADFDDVRVLRDQPVGDGLGVFDMGGMHGYAGRFIENDEKFVLEKDFYRKIRIGRDEFLLRLREIDECQHIAGFDRMTRFCFDFIDEHEPFLYDHGAFVAADDRIASQRRLLHQEVVESLVGFVGFDDVSEKHRIGYD